MKKTLKIGNAQAFWGDRTDAAATLLSQQPDLDYITLDYLSEVSLSIMAAQRAKNPEAGYARDFLDVIRSLIPFWQEGWKFKVIANAGGLAPKRCAEACAEILKQAGCNHIRIGIVSGDDVLSELKEAPNHPNFANLDTKDSLVTVVKELETANAYFGAKPIVEAIRLGADLIITGRIADPSLTVAPCVAHYNWGWDEYDKLAQATLAGHLIECGTQVTGGISTGWMNIADVAHLGFPFVEVAENSDFVITKPAASAGEVSIATVKEQMLYELGNPDAYLSPDVTLSILNVSLTTLEKNRIQVIGAKGKSHPPTYKVSATYRDGFKAEGMLAICGHQAAAKAQRAGEMLLERMRQDGYAPERYCIECLGAGGLVPGIRSKESDTNECLMRVCISDHRIAVLENFVRQIAPLVTSGPQGTTGYTTGRPHIRPIFGYWPCLISCHSLTPHVECITL